MCSGLLECWRSSNALARLHDRMDQRFALLIVVLYRERVAGHTAVRPVAPPNLLAARPGRFSGRMLAARRSGIFLELVSAIERRRIGGGGEARADAKAVDRSIGSGYCHELILIEATTGEDRHIS